MLSVLVLLIMTHAVSVVVVLHVFWVNKTSSIDKPVEESLLPSPTAICLSIEYAIKIEMKYIQYKSKR